ncbi:protein YebG [Corallococcus coralloides]|uniref:Protein YebG n=1 Tax=Corallococcus coralloides TaxID=184914 RepID=A0A410RPF7_CORCK|nr:ChbG/HpnK family deacetylase [Corallococcus coralloides]QAT83698.1 protein YebG [Corallococcus coralloides]
MAPCTRLIVNADDLGLHPSLDAGILKAHREGIVTSATLLAMGPCAAEAVGLAKAQGLAVGVHLALSTRLPCAAPSEAVRTVAPGGRLMGNWAEFAKAWMTGRVRRDELERELSAQLSRARELGARVDHLDGHQHLHLLPGVRPVVEGIAAREGLPLRWPDALPRVSWLRAPGPALKTTVLAVLARTAPRARPGVRRVSAGGVFEAGRLDESALLAVLDSLPAGDFELGCHPGEGAPQVPEDPAWTYGWEAELAALTSPRVKAKLVERGITLANYGELQRASAS